MVGRLVRVLQRSRLEDAHLVLVGGGNLSRVRTAVKRRNADIVVYGTWDDLNPFEIAGQYHNVTSCGVGLTFRGSE